MPIANYLFEAEEDATLFTLENVEAQYKLLATNTFIMGKANPIMSLSTESTISIKQTIHKNNIHTSIITENITGTTDNETMKPHLQQALLLGSISKQIDVVRNSNGAITSVANKKQLHDDWQLWKKDTLPTMYKDSAAQETFIKNYEKGLDLFEDNIPHNLNNFILIPDIYHIKNYVSLANSNATRVRILLSKLVKEMPIEYKFTVSAVKQANIAEITLTAELMNMPQMKTLFLEKLYNAQEAFSINDYTFSITVDYLVESKTGKIISGNLMLKEKMHDHLQYTLHMQLNQLAPTQIEEQPLDIKKPKRKILGDDVKG
jgi:hypothetical protein